MPIPTGMFAIVTLIALTALSPDIQGHVLRRSFLTNYRTSNQSECKLPSPCGWFMYQPIERTFVQYLEVCTCPPGMRCLADRDDVSISCWVYTCKVPPPEDIQM